MALVYRCAPLPPAWPGERTRTRKPSPFKVNWTSTMRVLETEIRALNGRDVVMRLSVGADQIRIDGGVKANARISDPSVIIEFRAGPDVLSFPCDRFNWWEDNVRAIALALEALRKVDRYGVRAGRQYEGFKALPGGSSPQLAMTDARAADLLHQWSEQRWSTASILDSAEVAKHALRVAARIAHPDNVESGSTEAFQELQEVKRVLSKRHGVSL